MSSTPEPPPVHRPQPTDADPIDVLVHESDPGSRSKAHRELGRRAVAREDRAMAQFHFREALDLDPTDEVTAEELRRVSPPPEKPPGLIGRLFRRRTSS